WQDIAVDWEKDRVYLPATDMRAYRVTTEHIAMRRCDDAWRELLRFETARTRVTLQSGRPLTRTLPLRAGLELKMVVAGGLRILDAIDGVRGDIFNNRPTLKASDWARLVVSLAG